MAITKIRGTQIHDLTLQAGHFLLTDGGTDADYADFTSIAVRVADAAQANEAVALGQLTTAAAAIDAKIEAMAVGLSPNPAVKLASTDAMGGVLTGNVLEADAVGVLTIDGVDVDGVVAGLGDRIMLTAQANAAQNGIYTVTTLGTAEVKWQLTRATNFDNSPDGEIRKGSYAYAELGIANMNKGFYVTGLFLGADGTTPVDPVEFVLNTDHIVFGLFNNIVNPSVVAGDGITASTTNGSTLISANIDGTTIKADVNGALYVDTTSAVGSANDGDGIVITSGVIDVDILASNGLAISDETSGYKLAIKATTFFLNNFKVKHGTCAGGTAEAVEITDAALSSYDELCHKVYLNGQLLRLTTDYTIATTNTTKATVTFAETVVTVANDVVRVEGFVDSASIA